MRLGVHISADLFDLEEIKGRPCQLFIGSPLSIPSFPQANFIKDASFLSKGILGITHACFFINLAAEVEGKRKRAVGMSKMTLKLAKIANCKMVVFHAGSGVPSNVVKSLKEIMEDNPIPRILLESDAGGGRRIGKIKILSAIKSVLKDKVGVCLDTAHSFARGETKDFKSLVSAFEYCQPELIHLNDPNPEVDFGSHRDRHSVLLGEGGYGEDILKFACWIQDRTPMILEQPLSVALNGIKRLEEYERRGSL